MSLASHSLTIFVVAGRLGKSLVVTKTIPIIETGKTEKVYIFRETEGFSIAGASYITLPKFILKIKPASLKRIIRFIYEPIQLLYYTIKLKPNLINGIFTLPKGLNSLIVGKLCGIKTVVSVIGGIVEITTRLPVARFWERVNIKMLKACDAVTTTGSVVTNYLVQNGVPRDKQFIYPGCIQTDVFKFDESVEKDIDVLFVGTFRRLKGPDRVIEVIKRLLLDNVSINAVFLGSGYLLEEMQSKIETEQLEKHVKIIGYVNEPASYFQRAKTLMMPSTSEGLPMAMLEAMACGCVPIVSNVGNIADAAKKGVNAKVIDHWNDIEAFTNAAKLLINNNQMHKQMALEGINTIKNHYAPNKQSEVVTDMFSYVFPQ